MMKKAINVVLFLFCLSIFSSCGPRRYKCGPYRCETKAKPTPAFKLAHTKNTSSVV